MIGRVAVAVDAPTNTPMIPTPYIHSGGDDARFRKCGVIFCRLSPKAGTPVGQGMPLVGHAAVIPDCALTGVVMPRTLE